MPSFIKIGQKEVDEIAWTLDIRTNLQSH